MKGVFKKTALFLLSAAGIMLILIGTYTLFAQEKEIIPTPTGRNVSISGEDASPGDEAPLREDMLDTALRCVVGISSADSSQGVNKKTKWYMGSGVLATEDGYIITNHHVIGARPERIEVTLHSGQTLEGKTVWSDSALDLAIVKIDGAGYPHCTLGDAKTVRVGENVVAIGIALHLFPHQIMGLLGAAGYQLRRTPKERSYQYLIDVAYNSTVYECNEFLKKLGMQPLTNL